MTTSSTEVAAIRTEWDPWVSSYIALAHVGFLFGVWYAWTFPIPWQIWAMGITLGLLFHLSISDGNHRLLAHSSYEARKSLQWFWAVVSPGAGQGPSRWWAMLHIIHHKFTDIIGKDPYTVLEGFWHAHMLWMCKKNWRTILRKYGKEVRGAGLNNRALRFQRKYYVALALAMGAGLPTLLGWCWGYPLGGFVVGTLIRLAPQLNFTWTVNSFAHLWGLRPYNKNITAADNPYLGIVTVGEASGHNKHHEAAYAFQLGDRWWKFDIGAWFLWLLWLLGLVGNLKRAELNAEGRLRPAKPIPWLYRRRAV